MNNQERTQDTNTTSNDGIRNNSKPGLGQHTEKSPLHLETEKKLHADILKITLLIKEQYPELSKYLEEMTVTIPDEQDPVITLRNLQAYYDSLNQMVSKYQEDHQASKK
ncbi:MAG: hypothetical protein HYZ42_07685 [Bacteroidetes bacterium]|nr:hypothetical protein [Bacteroidota bacterium]